MKNFKQLRQETLKECYLHKNIFQKDEYVMSSLTGEKGRIHRSGVNYVIVVTEEGNMFRAWVKDIRILNTEQTINKKRKNIFFTNGKTETNDTNPS